MQFPQCGNSSSGLIPALACCGMFALECRLNKEPQISSHSSDKLHFCCLWLLVWKSHWGLMIQIIKKRKAKLRTIIFLLIYLYKGILLAVMMSDFYFKAKRFHINSFAAAAWKWRKNQSESSFIVTKYQEALWAKEETKSCVKKLFQLLQQVQTH